MGNILPTLLVIKVKLFFFKIIFIGFEFFESIKEMKICGSMNVDGFVVTWKLEKLEQKN